VSLNQQKGEKKAHSRQKKRKKERGELCRGFRGGLLPRTRCRDVHSKPDPKASWIVRQRGRLGVGFVFARSSIAFQEENGELGEEGLRVLESNEHQEGRGGPDLQVGQCGLTGLSW